MPPFSWGVPSDNSFGVEERLDFHERARAGAFVLPTESQDAVLLEVKGLERGR